MGEGYFREEGEKRETVERDGGEEKGRGKGR